MFLLVCFSAAEAPASQNKPSAARAAKGDAGPKTTPEKINRFASALTLGLVDVGRVNTQTSGGTEGEVDRQKIAVCVQRWQLHNESVVHEGCF